MPSSMLICEGDAGTIISTGAATREFLGCEDLRGRSLADILPEGALSARLREIGELVPDEPRTATWTFVVGGRNVAVQVKLVKIGTRCVIAIPQSEPELASTSARLAYLLRATSAITYSCTDVDAEGVARVTFMSENVSEVLGYEAQEFLDDPELWTRAVHPAPSIPTTEPMSSRRSRRSCKAIIRSSNIAFATRTARGDACATRPGP